MTFFTKIYESWRKIQYEKYEVILENLRLYGLELNNKYIFDLGSSKGFLHDFLEEKGIKPRVFVAMDVDKEAIRKNRTSLKVLGRGEALPFKREIFDVIFCIDVLHLLKRVVDIDPLKNGGVLIISLPERYEHKMNAGVEHLTKNGCKPLSLFEISGQEKEKVAIIIRE